MCYTGKCKHEGYMGDCTLSKPDCPDEDCPEIGNIVDLPEFSLDWIPFDSKPEHSKKENNIEKNN